jgi:hypothetical protein
VGLIFHSRTRALNGVTETTQAVIGLTDLLSKIDSEESAKLEIYFDRILQGTNVDSYLPDNCECRSFFNAPSYANKESLPV